MNYHYLLSVHDIVDLLLRKGHIDTRVFNNSTMQEGSRLHAIYQKEQGNDYISEYSLQKQFIVDNFILDVNGKADGVIIDSNQHYTVEEIKTTIDDLDQFIQDHGEWHLGQAIFYAYILSKDHQLKSVDIKMTYIKQNNYKERKSILKTYSAEELESFVTNLIFQYVTYLKEIQKIKIERNQSAKNIVFPFQNLRSGQKEMMDKIQECAKEKKDIFIEAPTGIGKTISVLFPLISLFGTGRVDRVFYLTSKNSIKNIAIDTLSLFQSQGLKCKSISFTSKDNICFNDKRGHCNPDECPFAKNYYDKIYQIIFKNITEKDIFDRKEIERIAREEEVCPYQLQLDIGQYCDVLVCDYSYVYDFRDYIQLEETNKKFPNNYLCVDECHNLPERVRDMYSTNFFINQFKDALSLCTSSVFFPLQKDIEECIKAMEHFEFDKEDFLVQKAGIYVLDEPISTLFLNRIDAVLSDIKAILKKHVRLVTDELTEFFFLLNTFYTLANIANEEFDTGRYLTYFTIRNDELQGIRIVLLDPREIIQYYSSMFKSTIYFSATLSPKNYYINLLGGDINSSEKLILPSPFNQKNRRVFVDSLISLRYKDRDETLYSVYSLIRTAVSEKKGNYFIFCPSFEYLERLLSFFQQEPLENTDLIAQSRFMNEEERKEFLGRFKEINKKTTIGFLVLGGIFSEGIDLVGDRLIGAIIVSVGLPQISFERDHIKEYYDKLNTEENNGFDYAYSYPGINRVLQAAGRVIRTENDRGFILFIDSRFKRPIYNKIIQEIYPDYINIISASQLRMQLRTFWKENKK